MDSHQGGWLRKLTSLARDFPVPASRVAQGARENTTDWLEEVLPFKELLVPSLNVSQLSGPCWEEMDRIGNGVRINLSLHVGQWTLREGKSSQNF